MPPFPGDTITLLGAYLAGRGFLNPVQVFFWTALGNLASNLLIYYVGRYSGRELIRNHPRIFHPELLPRAALFYRKWGIGALFLARFLVGIRSIIPLFAGISRFRLRRFLLPVACAITVQHALFVYLGFSVGRNWEYVKSVVRDFNMGMGLVALAVAVLGFVWFRKIRSHSRQRAVKKEKRREFLKKKRGNE